MFATLHWNQLAPLLYEAGLIAKLDGVALRMFCETLEIYERAQHDLRHEDLVILNPDSRNPKANPLIAIRNQAESQIERWCKKFGLTPVDRTGLNPSESGESDDDVDNILRFGIAQTG